MSHTVGEGSLREEDVKAEELRVRRLEAEKGLAELKVPLWRQANPLVLAIVAGAITLLGNVWVAYYNGEATLALEREKAKFDLILKAIATNNSAAAVNNIRFFIKAGLLDDPTNSIGHALDIFPPTLPASVAQRETVVDAIDSLTDAQAIAVYKALVPSIASRRPEVQVLLKESDPNETAASNGASARALLKRWVVVDGDPAFVTTVTAAIASARAK